MSACRVARRLLNLNCKMDNKNDNKKDKQELKHIIRVANTDLDGSKQTSAALTKIKGISFVFANAICNISNIEKNKKAGLLSEGDVAKLNDVIKNPLKFNIPKWMLNRRKDYETNEDKHLIGPDLKFIQENDIKRMKKIRSYKGSRHSAGLPVRGQKTKANFRKKKGKGKGSLGVKRKRIKAGKV